MPDHQVAVPPQNRNQPVVCILIDNDYLEITVRLAIQAGEESVEFGCPVPGRYH
jgi:hypothetical protein